MSDPPGGDPDARQLSGSTRGGGKPDQVKDPSVNEWEYLVCIDWCGVVWCGDDLQAECLCYTETIRSDLCLESRKIPNIPEDFQKIPVVCLLQPSSLKRGSCDVILVVSSALARNSKHFMLASGEC